MEEKITHKIVVFESNTDERKKVVAALSKAGYAVKAETSSSGVQEIMKKAKRVPVSLLICGFEMSKQSSPGIFQNMELISPFTQKMVLIPSNQPDKLIHTINRAKINSCLSFPFQDEDLINQTETCCKKFVENMRQTHLKQVIAEQNQKLYKCAQNFKQKEKKHAALIGEKKKIILKLKDHLKGDVKKKLPEETTAIETIFKNKKLQHTPETYLDELNKIITKTKVVFSKIAQANSIEFHQDVNIEKIMKQKYKKSAYPELIKKIMPYLASIKKTKKKGKASLKASQNFYSILPENEPLNDYFELAVTRDQLWASLKVIQDPVGKEEKKKIFTTSNIIKYIRKCKVFFGIISDAKIKAWLSSANTSSQPIVIAAGKDTVPGRPGIIKYHFSSDYATAGKVREDGTIDFRERGDIPFVHEGDLLAEKLPAVAGIPGKTIINTVIPPVLMSDPELEGGSGTRISEDGTQIFSTMEGMPVLDKTGVIIVTPDLQISGDVNYKTGNINFAGNILVTGIVRDGFKVKGNSLTATQIEGGTIELAKDLYVLDGIINSNINVAGSIETKYIHDSKIEGFCDVNITREIIESNINISGMLKIELGSIINSTIFANCGIEANNIGSRTSVPNKLMIGVNEYVNGLIHDLEISLEECDKDIAKINEEEEVKELEDQDAALGEKEMAITQVQKKFQLETNRLKKELSGLEPLKDQEQIQNLTKEIDALKNKTVTAEQRLNTLLDGQKEIGKRLENKKERINDIEKMKDEFLHKKTIIEDMLKEPQINAKIIVYHKIFADTSIEHPHASTLLKEDRSRCKIQVSKKKEGGISFHEFDYLDL
ncbi:MAG: DUF342 domain-containing protein [Desulfobacteraceae bacterium]|nr:DUF342 domain-containing protein [Desulfobacteraceae bacterium]